MRFLVVGAGSWGTAFTRVLLEGGHDVVLACRSPEQAEAIAATGRNPHYLQGVDLSGAEAIALADATGDVDVVVAAVPSQAFAGVIDALPGDAPVLSLAKGLDPETGERLSTRVRGRSVAVLSRPNMAEEIAEGLPTAAVIASEDGFLAGRLQHALNSSLFRAYVNPDLVGVELCAAAKNVIALAAGGVDGLGLGDNAKASLIARGLAEMARLGEAAGGGGGALPGPPGGGGSGGGDLRRPRGDRRPRRHVLEPPRPQPPCRRAHRPGPDAGTGGRRDRPHRRGSDDGPHSARPLAPSRRGAPDPRRRLRGPLGPEHHRPRRRPDGP